MPDFIVIPTVLIKDKNIQPLDCQVYGVVYWASKMRNEKCIMSNETIAKALNASSSGVAHALSRLAKGRYIYVDLDTANRTRKEIVPLISFKHTPEGGVSSNEQGGSSNEQGGYAQTSNRVIVLNKNTEQKQKKTQTPISDIKLTSKNSVMPLSDLERWELAKEMNIQLAVVVDTEKAFWDYDKHTKYKTTYKVLRQWIRMRMEKGEVEENDEMGVLLLQNNHPDKQAEIKYYFDLAKKRGDV